MIDDNTDITDNKTFNGVNINNNFDNDNGDKL